MYVHAQAPCRIGIAGGGSDLPAWTKEMSGRCLSLAVASYAHVAAIARPDGQVVASYRQRDAAASATEIANGLIRESALAHGWLRGFEVHTLSEVTSRGSGLGVSSAIAVALAAAFARMRWLADGQPQGGLYTGIDDPADIARSAWTVEIDRLRRPIGRQDHMAAAWGGLRLYGFEGDGAHVTRTLSDDDAAWVAAHLLLVRLPEGHDAGAILSGVQRAEQVRASYDAVDIALAAIKQRNPGLLGMALAQCHDSKRSIPGAIPRSVEEVCREIGGLERVLGLKVAGAGGGGHAVVATTEPSRVAAQIAQRAGLRASLVRADLSGARSEGWV